jgi:hypothetical protein
VLFRAATGLGETGEYAAAYTAYTAYTDLHAAATHHLGPDDPDTLSARYNVAYWKGEAGDVFGAAAGSRMSNCTCLDILGLRSSPDGFAAPGVGSAGLSTAPDHRGRSTVR